MITKTILGYLLLINILGFIVIAVDKHKAKYRRPRIPERTLFLVATVGGALGILISMNMFRHKTRNKNFRYGVPALLLGWMAAFMYLSLRTV